MRIASFHSGVGQVTARVHWLALLFLASAASAQPRLAGVFSDHLVLQRDQPIRVWGFGARPGQKLEIRFGDARATAHFEHGDRWAATLPAQGASGRGLPLELVTDGEVSAAIQDVVLGDVWLAAGQSNMQWPIRQVVKHLPEAKAWVEESQRPLVRVRRINDPVLKGRDDQSPDLQPGNWTPMSPQSVTGFSAVAAVYARELHESLKIPIGIIDVSWGGKPIEPFIPRPAYRTPLLERILQLADAGKLDELKSLPGGVIIRNPQGHPGAIYNARMHPLIPLRLKGFIWYQAESNCGRGEDPRHYRLKQQAMIEGWRAAWRNEKLPFFFVQLPGFPGATGWIRMREEQRLALSVPHTGMAVTIDVRGEGIHPPDKLSVGRRLAAITLSKTYNGGSQSVNGPVLIGQRVVGHTMRLRFGNGDLMVGDKPGAAPAHKTPGEALRWFELADAEGRWHPAAVIIEGDEVVLSAPGVANPRAARYACATEPWGGNLYNRAGYPASPFCTDLALLPWEDHGAGP